MFVLPRGGLPYEVASQRPANVVHVRHRHFWVDLFGLRFMSLHLSFAYSERAGPSWGDKAKARNTLIGERDSGTGGQRKRGGERERAKTRTTGKKAAAIHNI